MTGAAAKKRFPIRFPIPFMPAFTRVTACLLAESPEAPLSIEGFGSIVTPLPLRLLPAGAIPCLVGIAPTEDRRLFTAHKEVGSLFS
jgi:hypothetical protein